MFSQNCSVCEHRKFLRPFLLILAEKCWPQFKSLAKSGGVNKAFVHNKSKLNLSLHSLIMPKRITSWRYQGRRQRKMSGGGDKTKKIETYGYNFRSLWLTKCSIIFLRPKPVYSCYNDKRRRSFS